jgi:hypothetical protein
MEYAASAALGGHELNVKPKITTMRTYELCYLGNTGGSHRFRVTQVTEAGQPVEGGAFGDLFFKKPILKSLYVGAYCLTDTEDENTFRNWRRTFEPAVLVSNDVITNFSIEVIAKRRTAYAAAQAKKATPDADSLIEKLRENMFMLDRKERGAFALYVYQKLL